MPKSSLATRSYRMLRLLQGLADARVAAAMGPAGFTEAELDEGWRLLRDASRGRVVRPQREAAPSVVSRVDAWENYWFPIVDASLRSRFPAVHRAVFLNLAQRSGATVLITVNILRERLVALGEATDAESRAARALLERRGLTAGVLDELRALLDEAQRLPPIGDLAGAEERAAEQARAESAMWDWFREWSQIARVAVKDGRLLMQLGLGAIGRPRKRRVEEGTVRGGGSGEGPG